MAILSLCQADTDLKLVASTRGGEYAGPCPWCGGRDRFRVWPKEGRYWCRGCGRTGDEVQYLRDRLGMSFREALETAGRTSQVSGLPREYFKRPQTSVIRSLPCEQWRQSASKLTGWAAKILAKSKEALSYLAGRGLIGETIAKRRLGLIPTARYVKRQAWGLPEEQRKDGRPKDIWLPAGVVIPHIIGGEVVRVRIRRWEGDPRYYLLPGSFTGSMTLYQTGPVLDDYWQHAGEAARAAVMVVVESELDAILLEQECGDIAGVVALGTALGKPDAATASLLAQAELILVALDYDRAGTTGWQWWRKNFPSARRWPAAVGKDLGDMQQKGISLLEWLECGIREYMPY